MGDRGTLLSGKYQQKAGVGAENQCTAGVGWWGRVGWSRVRWGQGTVGGWVVITELSEGYNTLVGDRGTLLSGKTPTLC